MAFLDTIWLFFSFNIVILRIIENLVNNKVRTPFLTGYTEISFQLL